MAFVRLAAKYPEDPEILEGAKRLLGSTEPQK